MKQFLILCVGLLFLGGCAVGGDFKTSLSKADCVCEDCKDCGTCCDAGCTWLPKLNASTHLLGEVDGVAKAGLGAGLGDKGLNAKANAGLLGAEAKAGLGVGKNTGLELTVGDKDNQYGLKSGAELKDGSLNTTLKLGKIK